MVEEHFLKVLGWDLMMGFRGRFLYPINVLGCCNGYLVECGYLIFGYWISCWHMGAFYLNIKCFVAEWSSFCLFSRIKWGKWYFVNIWRLIFHWYTCWYEILIDFGFRYTCEISFGMLGYECWYEIIGYIMYIQLLHIGVTNCLWVLATGFIMLRLWGLMGKWVDSYESGWGFFACPDSCCKGFYPKITKWGDYECLAKLAILNKIPKCLLTQFFESFLELIA